MSSKAYEDDCPGCRPVAMDPKTGKVLPDDHPLMLRMARVWANKTTREQRVAWHNVTCQNSRHWHDLKLARQFIKAVQEDDA
jgi:hypothetical protein